jgi:hypothetical protein
LDNCGPVRPGPGLTLSHGSLDLDPFIQFQGPVTAHVHERD